MDSPSALDYVALLTGIGGGLALFLYGMRKMSDALRVVAGDRMKNVLGHLTRNRVTGALTGAAVTAVIQSSSVTTVMVVGFVTAGLINFTQSVGIIMGANVGTTVTAQIIAFKVTKYSLVMIALGFLLELVGKTPRIRHYGVAIMGLGLLFFGMELMSDAALPLRTYAPFIDFMQELKNPVFGILAGAAFTAVVQSSSATTGIVIVLASQGFITLEAGIALIFGANLGTCATAMLAAIGKPREAVKAAVVHVLFNLVGVLLWLGFIPQFAEAVRGLSPAAPGLAGAERLAAEVPRQIANAHTLFNVANTVILLGFAGLFARLVEMVVPEPRVAVADAGRAVYLKAMFLDQPGLALDQARLELVRLGDHVLGMARRSLPVAMEGSYDDLRELQEGEESVDRLYAEITAYLGEVSQKPLVDTQPGRLHAYVGVANYLENVADVVGKGLAPTGARRLEGRLEINAGIRRALAELHEEACGALERALKAFETDDTELAAAVTYSKKPFGEDVEALRERLLSEMTATGKAGVAAYHVSLDLTEHTKRLQTLARRIARLVQEQRPEEQEGSEGAPPQAA